MAACTRTWAHMSRSLMGLCGVGLAVLAGCAAFSFTFRGISPERASATATEIVTLTEAAAIRINNEIGTTRAIIDPDATEATIAITRIALADTQQGALDLLPFIVVTVTPPGESDDGDLHIDAPRPTEATGTLGDFEATFDEDEIHLSWVTTSTLIAQVSLELTLPPGHALIGEHDSGTLTVDDADTPVTLSTRNGSIRISNAQGPITVDADNGSIRVLSHHGSVDASTENGTIRVDIVELADDNIVTLASDNGTIDLELPASANANLTAITQNGTVDVELGGFDSVTGVSAGNGSFTGTINAGGATVDVRTDNGTIDIEANP